MLAAAVVTLPKKRGFDAAGERQADLGVAVEAPVDDVVVQADVRIPVIHELREMRERQALQRQARLHALAVLVGHDLGDHLLEAGAVGGRLAHHARGILLAVLLPGELGVGHVRVEQLLRELLHVLA